MGDAEHAVVFHGAVQSESLAYMKPGWSQKHPAVTSSPPTTSA